MLKDYLEGLVLKKNTSMFVKEIDYVIKDCEDFLQTKLDEFHAPSKEVTLLGRLMYDIGYLSFLKPTVLEVTLASVDDLILEPFQQFSNGTDMFYSSDTITIVKDMETIVKLKLGTHIRLESSIGTSLYHKVKLGVTYTEFSEVTCTSKGNKLLYSQAFVNAKSDYSLEVLADGELQLVFRKLNLKSGDSVTVDLITSRKPITSTIPRIKGVANSAKSTNVIIMSEYEPPLSIEDMQDIIKYNKNINNSLVYNEQYENFIRSHISQIQMMKVWHEGKEVSDCAVNKVFISYLSKDNVDLDNEIVSLIEEHVYGKIVVIVPPIIQEIGVRVTVINNIRRKIPIRMEQAIKGAICKYYTSVSQEDIYRLIADEVKKFNTDVILKISDRGTLDNNKFFIIKEDGVLITFVERF